MKIPDTFKDLQILVVELYDLHFPLTACFSISSLVSQIIKRV